jgi:TatD DNase family protein
MKINFHTHTPAPNSIVSFFPYDYHLELDSPFTCGIHPWLKDVKFDEKEFTKIMSHPYFIGLGEIGLDKCQGIEFSQQVSLFEQQLQFASDYQIPFIVIHCVRAWEEVIRCIKTIYPDATYFFHDYNGNPEITKRLQQYLKCYFGYGVKLFQENSKGFKQFSSLKLENILLETDDSQYSIDEVYVKAANTRCISLIELEQSMQENFKTLRSLVSLQKE